MERTSKIVPHGVETYVEPLKGRCRSSSLEETFQGILHYHRKDFEVVEDLGDPLTGRCRSQIKRKPREKAFTTIERASKQPCDSWGGC